jgi:hypothetical protein
VSSEWWGREDDGRYLALDDLWPDVKARSERRPIELRGITTANAHHKRTGHAQQTCGKYAK